MPQFGPTSYTSQIEVSQMGSYHISVESKFMLNNVDNLEAMLKNQPDQIYTHIWVCSKGLSGPSLIYPPDLVSYPIYVTGHFNFDVIILCTPFGDDLYLCIQTNGFLKFGAHS